MVVEAAGLSAWLEGREVLRGIDLTVQSGQCVALLGSNGAGKTTLLRVLATLLPVGSGRLTLFGRHMRRPEPEARSRLGLIGHQPMLYGGLTVRENLELAARLHRVERPRARAIALGERLGIGAQMGSRAGSLSRGLAQRAAIARALVHDPELLLADEPWTGLDRAAAGLLEDLLEELRRRGRTIILASHDLGRALRAADRVIVLREGQVALDAPKAACDQAAIGAAIGEELFTPGAAG